ncbi:hypothetical protein GPJ56_008825 [Histomonas meleagridis]|uniref:uncharacterized protein n=1 Tax=Histomonas meleagridis TaxID=135588 RepID=UPI00355A3B33|nr:hypothetical protein GPJ56_008825 [Histomonas meleagridis]KAH0805384.1 hypothetical protein GO595_001766 [Histomonas meleagridis]
MLFWYLFISLSLCEPYYYIPSQFTKLADRAKAEKRKRVLSEADFENAITPEKPYISDTFNGSVLYPLFGVTVKELEGSAISDDLKYVALIADRSTSIGQAILTEKSTYVSDTANDMFTLSQKVADDGEVTIFSVAKTEFMAVFNLFEIRMPSSNLQYDCQSYGKPFGSRCYAKSGYNWDEKKDMPKEIGLPEEIVKDKIKLFGGLYGNAEASFLLKKTGAFNAQLELDSSLVVKLAAGVQAKKVDYKRPSPIPIGEGMRFTIAMIPIKIFTVNINVGVFLVGRTQLENFAINIPDDVTYIKRYRLTLKKGCVLSLKGFSSPDMTKEFVVDYIDQDGNILDTKPELKVSIEGDLSISLGIRVEANISSFLDGKLYVEAGAKAGLKLKFGIDTTKCTSPALYGSLTPYVKSYLTAGGELSLFGIKVIDGTKWQTAHEKLIWEKQIGDEDGTCLFDPLTSNELDDELKSKEARTRYIVKVSNPVYHKEDNLDYQIKITAKNLTTQQSQVKYYTFSKQNGYTDCYIYMEKTDSYNEFTIKSYNLDTEVVISNEDIMKTYNYNDEDIGFTIELKETSPITKIGTQFIWNDINGYYSYNTVNPSSNKYKTMALIIHSNVTGYTSSYNNYHMMDEYYDDEQTNVYNIKMWKKLTLTEVTTKDTTKCNSKYRITQMHNNLRYRVADATGCTQGTSKISFPVITYQIPKIDPGNSEAVSLKLNFKIDDITKEVNIKNSELGKETFTIQIDETYSMTFNVENFEDVEYLTELSDSYIGSLQPYEKLAGVICRLFEPIYDTGDYKRDSFRGEQIDLSLSFEEGESYGVIRYLFNGDGYDFSHLYLLINLPNIQPLVSEPINLDQEHIYLIKLQEGLTLFKTNPNDQTNKDYDIVIPFRRRDKSKQTLQVTFYTIFQTPDNNDMKPHCSEFPIFTVPAKSNVYFGCLKPYSSSKEYVENKWKYYVTPSENVVLKREMLPSLSSGSFNKLIRMNSETTSTTINSITVAMKQDYINLTEDSRQLAIDDATIKNIHQYMKNENAIYVKCDRCDSIYIDDVPKGTHILREGDIFQIYTNDYTTGFTILAYCTENTSVNCIFPLDISKHGTVLLKYNQLESSTGDPGVEEFFDWNKEGEIQSNRLMVGCKQQIMKPRSDTIYGSKNWKGSVDASISNIETNHISITLSRESVNKMSTLTMKSGETIIPFSSQVYANSDDNTLKTYFNEIGITLDKTKQQISEAKDDFRIDEEGRIIVKDDYFNKDTIKKNIKDGKQIHFLELNKEYYTMTYSAGLKICGIPIIGWIIIGFGILMVFN